MEEGDKEGDVWEQWRGMGRSGRIRCGEGGIEGEVGWWFSGNGKGREAHVVGA